MIKKRGNRIDFTGKHARALWQMVTGKTVAAGSSINNMTTEEMQQQVRLIEDNHEGIIEEITVGRATSEELGEEKVLIIALAGSSPIVLTKEDLSCLTVFHEVTEVAPKP